MAFNEELPRWENEGASPPEAKKDTTGGWEPEEKPPASWFNWFWNRAYKAVQELQNKAVHETTFDSHTTNNTPHLDANETHNWGFRVNADKSVTMLFEEV